MSEQEKFLADLQDNSSLPDILTQSLIDNTDSSQEGSSQNEQNKQADSSDDEEKLKNRKERRLYERLQRERQGSIEIAARLAAIEEARKISQDSPTDDYTKRIEKIYGTDSIEAREATRLLAEALRGAEERAVKIALDKIKEDRQREIQEQQEAERQLNGIIESIEDEYDVDLSDSSEDRKGFLKLLEKLSPKNKDGEIIEFADGHSVYEIYKLNKERSSSTEKAKSLSSRSMTRSSGDTQSSVRKQQEDSVATYLKEHGII